MVIAGSTAATKARRANTSLFSGPGRKFVLSFAPPIFVGGLLTILLVQLGLMSALPEEQREILVLREIEEMDYREIATITSVPIGTVMSRLARARAALRARRRAWTSPTGRMRFVPE